MHRSSLAALAVFAVVSLAVAACGDDDGAADPPSTTTTTSTTSTTSATADALYVLPAVTGPHGVGVRTVGAAVVRYPAVPGAGGDPVPALDEATVQLTADAVGVPVARLEAVRSHAVADAPQAGTDGTPPVVVLSSGFGTPRVLYTALADELASHGYVVAAVDHADPVEPSPTIAADRAADLRALVDDLVADGLEVDRLAVVGHSIGGAAAAELLTSDDRFDAGMNLDGSVLGPAAETGVERPYVVVLSGGRPASSDPSLTRFLDSIVTLDGTGHQSFSDIPFVVEALPELAARFDVGTLDAATTHRRVADLVLAFLREHLR